MKIKAIIMLAVLTGCNTTNYQASEPTASPEDIKQLQEEFAGIENLNVTGNGVIEFTRWAGDGYRWSKASVHSAAYTISCEQALPLLEKGFITNIRFKGKGGTSQQYDLNRCEQEAQN